MTDVIADSMPGLDIDGARERALQRQREAAGHSNGKVFPVPGDIGGEQGNTGNNDDPPLWVNVATLLDQGLPDAPEPEFLRRVDQQCLFYAGQVNLLFGDPESGKTLVALAAAAEALIRGRKVAIIDIDHNGVVSIVCRLIDMGVDETVLRNPDKFRYVEPEDKIHLLLVVAALKTWKPAMVVVDSIGELLPLMSLSSNSPDDFTIAHARVLKPLAMAGACVVAIDHLPKNTENKQNGPTGTAAKRRAVGGVSLRVTVAEQFTPGKGGKACLTINKDRHGGLRRVCPVEPGKEPIAGWFKIEPNAECIAWTIESPQPGDTSPKEKVDPRDIATLNKLDPPPKSVRDVKARCNWRTDRAMLTLAEWRSRVPGEQSGNTGTEADGALPFPAEDVRSPFPTYVSGNGEHSEDDPTQAIEAQLSTVDELFDKAEESGSDEDYDRLVAYAMDVPMAALEAKNHAFAEVVAEEYENANNIPSRDWPQCSCGNKIFDRSGDRTICGRCTVGVAS